MARKKLIYEASESFYLGGRFIPKGSTVVKGSHEGDAVLKGRLKLFREFVPTIGTLEDVVEPKKVEPDPEPEVA